MTIGQGSNPLRRIGDETFMARLRHNRRTGATTVEFALVVPLVFSFFFAAFEFSRMGMMQHTTEMAAFEGARRSMVPGATAADAVNRANQVLATVGTRDASVTVTPTSITPDTRYVTVAVEVPLDTNAWVGTYFLRGMRFRRSYTLGRENVNWSATSEPSPSSPAEVEPPDDN